MRRRTTTQKLHEAISNNLLMIEKAEIYNKTSRKTDVIDKETFKENLEFLSESGVFSYCIGWYFEKINKTDGEYLIECCRLDGSVEVIVTAYLRVGENASVEDVEKTLLEVEEE